ncbi:ABC transporter permease [Riemerella columbipharyngis]|uniref:ABC-2 type transport system permease protein n=1 Tax=Riemerella columbipharyngis TaxID=1071918 RepID=A0A1G6YQP3_9FLAO|nr:ABC transporter permease [Riemerella columbipharyngis]SDD92353.1 ABC-2 type transport system permease protein [Riemerella columbipharyngis]
MISILKKELWSYLGNWGIWVIIAAFSLISSLFLFFFDNDFNIFEIGTASLQSFFFLAPWLLLFIMPALAMKTLAEEQQSGTLQWLFSQPVKTSQIVLGKYLSVCIMGLFCLVPTFVYLYTIDTLGVVRGSIDFGMTLGSYFGLIVLICSYSAIGIFASSFASNQITAYLFGVFINFILFYGIPQLASYKLLGSADYILENIGFYYHFNAFTIGLIDTRDVCYFLLVILISLIFANFFINKKK